MSLTNNPITRTFERATSYGITSGALAIVAMDGTILGGYGGFYIGQLLHTIAEQLPLIPDSFMSETPEKYRQLAGQLNELLEDTLWLGGEAVDFIYKPDQNNINFQPEWAD